MFYPVKHNIAKNSSILTYSEIYYELNLSMRKRKEGNVLFDDSLNTYLFTVKRKPAAAT